ncbi:MAG: DNA/RNA non-specific endonuclease [Bacteroidales bacterium]|nr:DNA/RNA non-specific endonuclease [Bacteroidales bacterium]
MKRILSLSLLCAALFAFAACEPDVNNQNGEDGPGQEQTGPGDEGGTGDEGGSGDQGGGDNPGGTGGEGTHVLGSGWAELPLMVDADHNGIDDNDANIYYASHSFQNNGVTWRNYTTCFSATDHCAFWVAAPRHKIYESGVTRKDSYQADPDIPASIQYKKKYADSGCNNGHMLGSAERLMNRQCNSQVFYFSNIAPQLSDTFNTGNGAWNNLEDFVDGFVVSDTLYVVIGCYFKDYTDAYGKTCQAKKISFGARSDVSFPTMMYYALLRTKAGNSKKSVKDCTAEELQCAAFVLRHNMEKGHKPQATDMMSVSDLERLTGFQYFVNVPNAPKATANAADWGL